MFTKHLLNVILGFCAMILLGLASLIAINSWSGGQVQSAPKMADTAPPKSSAVTLPPIKVHTTTKASLKSNQK